MTTITIASILDDLCTVVDRQRESLGRSIEAAERRGTDASSLHTRRDALNDAYGWIVEQSAVEIDERGAFHLPSRTSSATYTVTETTCQCRASLYGGVCFHLRVADLLRAALFAQRETVREVGYRIAKTTERKDPKPAVQFACTRPSWADIVREADELFS